MLGPVILSQYAIAMFGSVFVGSYLHELSHYFVGWLAQSEPELQRQWGIFASGVDHGALQSMDTTWIRLSGLAVLLWIPVAIISMLELIINWNPTQFFVSFTPVLVVMGTSESDIEAIRDPDGFREKWLKNEYERKMAFWPDK
jgi:hypothetical protein